MLKLVRSSPELLQISEQFLYCYPANVLFEM